MLLTAFMLLTVLMFGLLITNIMFRYVVPVETVTIEELIEVNEDYLYRLNEVTRRLVDTILWNSYKDLKDLILLNHEDVEVYADYYDNGFKPDFYVGKRINDDTAIVLLPCDDGSVDCHYIHLSIDKSYSFLPSLYAKEYVTLVVERISQ